MKSIKIALLIWCVGYSIALFAGPFCSKPLIPKMVDISGLSKPLVLQCFVNETFLETQHMTFAYARGIIESQGTERIVK